MFTHTRMSRLRGINSPVAVVKHVLSTSFGGLQSPLPVISLPVDATHCQTVHASPIKVSNSVMPLTDPTDQAPYCSEVAAGGVLTVFMSSLRL